MSYWYILPLLRGKWVGSCLTLWTEIDGEGEVREGGPNVSYSVILIINLFLTRSPVMLPASARVGLGASLELCQEE